MTDITTSSTSPQALPASWIEKLFDKMLLDYGKKFTDQWGGADPAKLIAHWAAQLAGYTPAELKRGYQALETLDWPPSLPQFKRMCRPTMDEAATYYEAVAGVEARARGEMGKWSHPAVFWAATGMAFDLKNQTHAQIKGRWEKALADEMDKGEWAPIPEPMVALPAPGKTKSDREHATRMLAQYRASDVLKTHANQRAWIGKIFERQKAKDPTLPSIAIRFAEEAMREIGGKR